MHKNKWFKEKLYPNNIGFSQSILIDKMIVESKSKFQKINIFTNPKLGKVLALDDVIQTTEADEFFYHEMFVHTPLLAHNNPENILIIGGGDGGILREVLKHKSVKKVTMIEIDEEVINLCAKHMPLLNNGAFKNPKAKVMVADGIEFVKTTTEKFDVILVDSTDPINVGEVLFTKEFYNHTKRILNNEGILITQSGVPFFQIEELLHIKNLLKDIYITTSFFKVPVPTYVGGDMYLGFHYNNGSYHNLKEETLQNKLTNNVSSCKDLKYYTCKIHLNAFNLPPYINNKLKET